MTHTVYEAKQLECRQAHTYDEGGLWTFPRCSSDHCGHWIMTENHEVRYFSRSELERKQNSPITPEIWNKHVEELLAAGWASNGAVNLRNTFGNFHNVVYLCRPLPPEQRRGRCGLISDITVEVST